MSETPMSRREAINRRLRETEGPIELTDLVAHLEREAVFLVATSLDLVEAGLAIAEDEVDLVGGWLQKGELRKATKDDHEAWVAASLRFTAIVVQPFVLVRAITEPGAYDA